MQLMAPLIQQLMEAGSMCDDDQAAACAEGEGDKGYWAGAGAAWSRDLVYLGGGGGCCLCSR